MTDPRTSGGRRTESSTTAAHPAFGVLRARTRACVWIASAVAVVAVAAMSTVRLSMPGTNPLDDFYLICGLFAPVILVVNGLALRAATRAVGRGNGDLARARRFLRMQILETVFAIVVAGFGTLLATPDPYKVYGSIPVAVVICAGVVTILSRRWIATATRRARTA